MIYLNSHNSGIHLDWLAYPMVITRDSHTVLNSSQWGKVERGGSFCGLPHVKVEDATAHKHVQKPSPLNNSTKWPCNYPVLPVELQIV